MMLKEKQQGDKVTIFFSMSWRDLLGSYSIGDINKASLRPSDKDLPDSILGYDTFLKSKQLYNREKVLF